MTSTLTPPATDTATPAQDRTTLGTVLVTGGSSGLGAATVAAVLAAGSHVVLASGRSPHGMTLIADLLDLPREGADRAWVVASNGAVLFEGTSDEAIHDAEVRRVYLGENYI